MPNYIFPLLGIIFAMMLLTTLSAFFSKFFIRYAQYIHIPDTIIAVIFLGIIGSLGELNLAITSLIVNYQEMMLGLVISVAISMILLVGGISVLYNKGIPTIELSQKKLLPMLSIIVILFILLTADQNLSRTDGIILILLFPFYIAQIIKNKSRFQVKSFQALTTQKEAGAAIVASLLLLINIFLTAGFALQQTYNFVNTSSIGLFVTGAVLLAPFSVIPELIFEMELSKNGTSKLALSDLITSCIANLTLVIGLVAIVNPIIITSTSNLLNFNLFFLAMIILIFNIYAFTGRKLDKKEGISMLILYFVYLFMNFLIIAT